MHVCTLIAGLSKMFVPNCIHACVDEMINFEKYICHEFPSVSDAGFGAKAAGRVLNKLMLRLGFKEYYAAGGDWGAAASLHMAIMFPE